MIFNSYDFLVFFFIIVSLKFLCPPKYHNWLLLVASYLFYSFWDARFMVLLLFSTVVDYQLALSIFRSTSEPARLRRLILSLTTNLGLLFFFKYIGLFAELINLFTKDAPRTGSEIFNAIILPVGISFYTFQSMSYTIDTYKKKLTPTTDFVKLALYVSFFPQLVAGPIERAQQLLPQLSHHKRPMLIGFEKGIPYIFWGLLLKCFMADNLGFIVDGYYRNLDQANALSSLFAHYAFAFQIFGDFAGYSFMAKGMAHILGIDLVSNFRNPYFAQNPRDFWRRWHISLSEWFRDYVYIPLGGNHGSHFHWIRNILITMTLAGIWHGSRINFLYWGLYHALLLILYQKLKPVSPKLPSLFKIVLMFHLVTFGWIFFRVESHSQLAPVLKSFLNLKNINFEETYFTLLKLIFYTLPILAIGLAQEFKPLKILFFKAHFILRSVSYTILFYLLIIWGVKGGPEFIYFQF